jgi:large subunit ribosomal protein L23
MSAATATEPAVKTASKKKSINNRAKFLPLKPRMTEKTYALSSDGVFVFDVPNTTNKSEVISAVEAQFAVSVTDARLLVSKGKKARSIRIGGTRRMVYGKRPDFKKAYVTLKSGDSIPIFEEIEKQEAKEAKEAEKTAKKKKSAAKTSKKQTAPEASKPDKEKGSKSAISKPERKGSLFLRRFRRKK